MSDENIDNTLQPESHDEPLSRKEAERELREIGNQNHRDLINFVVTTLHQTGRRRIFLNGDI